MTRPTRLKVEPLERRDQPSVFGNPWSNADSLTMSFAAEGVNYSTQTWAYGDDVSRLYSELNATMPTAVWQQEILRAVYAWTSVANINVGLVADNGRAFGSAGVSESVTAADIRVGAADQSTEVLATSIPYHPLTGYRAGNLMLNASKTFTQGGAGGTYDLYSVALHELSNVLGMADSVTDTASARFGTYNGLRSGVLPADAVAVQAMYGTRKADGFEGVLGNGTPALASTLTPALDPNNPIFYRVVADGDITTAADVDVYRFTTRSNTSQLTIRLGTAGKSLLAGKVELLDANGNVVATKENTSPLQGDTVFTVTGVSPNSTYYVRVSGGTKQDFAIGAYQLRVGFNYDPKVETKVDPRQQFGSDGGTNNTQGTATTLATTAGAATNSRYSAAGRIENLNDTDYYKVTAPAAGGPMTITVQGYHGLTASATVYNSAGQVVTSDILFNWENGLYRSQVPATTAGATYFVRLNVQDAAWSAWSGNYHLDVDFTQPLAVRQSAVSGTASQTSRVAVGLEVNENTAFTFGLNMVSSNLFQLNGVSVTIYDSTGAVVGNLWTDGLNSNDSMTAFLKKGKYTIAFEFEYRGNSSATATFDLRMAALSDPIDVYDPLAPTPPPNPYEIVEQITDPINGFFDPWTGLLG